MFKRSLVLLSAFFVLFPYKIYAADYSFTVGEKHWRVTLSQRALNQLGYKTDRVDGVFTQSTAGALEAFQKKYQLPLTKNIDKQTYQKLMELQKAASSPAGTPAPVSKSTLTAPPTPTVSKPSPAVIASGKTAVSSKPKSTSTATKVSSVQPKGLADKLVNTASKYHGVPYKFGGTTHKGFDCSGYTQVVFRQHGITLPRTSDMQYKLGRPVSKKDLRKGDLVFFSTYEPGPSHVGIYDGNGKFWNATTSRGVMASPLDDPYYWGPRYLGARRIF